jgi:hypothetical protein
MMTPNKGARTERHRPHHELFFIPTKLNQGNKMVATTGVFSAWLYDNKCYSIKGSLPFELGKTYKRRDGKEVTIIAINNHRGYETVQGDDGSCPTSGFRYNRANDRGRCTGSLGDYSDPRNLLPEFPPGVQNAGDGFFIPVSLLSGNKSAEVKAQFRELMIIENELNDLRYAANSNADWKSAYDQVFGSAMIARIKTLAGALKLNFTVDNRHSGNYAFDVRRFTWDFSDWLEDFRVFYA